MKNAYLAGGCFWCIAAPFYGMEGVRKVESGYSGGTEDDPTYEEVKAQKTSHRETIHILYDEEKVSYRDLLEIYFSHIDPFDGGGQFIDRGRSYTCAVFYTDGEQREAAEQMIRNIELEAGRKAFVSVESFEKFFPAEECHQDYALKNPEAFERELLESGRKTAAGSSDRAGGREGNP